MKFKIKEVRTQIVLSTSESRQQWPGQSRPAAATPESPQSGSTSLLTNQPCYSDIRFGLWLPMQRGGESRHSSPGSREQAPWSTHLQDTGRSTRNGQTVQGGLVRPRDLAGHSV